MGEEAKVKLEGKKKWRAGATGPRKQVSTPFKAPTSGLENVIFKMGHFTDAADFEEHKKGLARYCAVNFKDGGAMIQKAIDDMVSPSLVAPQDPPDTATAIEIKKWEKSYDAYDKKQRAWEDASARAFQLLLQHCHPDVEQHDEIKQGVMAYVEQDIRLYTLRQDRETTPLDFIKLVKAQADVINIHGGRAGYHPGLYKQHLKIWMEQKGLSGNPTQETMDQAMETSCEEYLACFVIRAANKERYEKLKDELDNDFLKGKDTYPKKMEDALRLLQSHKGGKLREAGSASINAGERTGVAFAQQGARSGGTRDMSKDKCYNCGRTGHHAINCEEISDEQRTALGVSNLVLGDGEDKEDRSVSSDNEGLLEGVGFLEVGRRATCNRNKIYLDSCATNHTIFAGEYASNIHKVAVGLRQNCNAGSSVTRRMGFWSRFKLWYSPNGIANLLSVPRLEQDGYRIEMSTVDGCRVYAPDGAVLHFKKDKGLCMGMPYLDMDQAESTYTSYPEAEKEALLFVQRVRNNYEGFSKQEVERAILARKAQGMMGSPSDVAFAAMVSAMPNCTITRQDITNTNALFGQHRKGMRGKTVRRTPERTEPAFVAIPKDYYELHKFVTLTADVMFVNGIPLFTTLSRDLRMFTAEHLPSRTAKQLSGSLNKVLNIYRRGGFTVRVVLMDMEFEPLADVFDLVTINKTAAREHVGEIERGIRSIKERASCTISEFPKDIILPQKFVIHLVSFVVFWLNATPSTKGISTTLSPREIVTQQKVDFARHCRVPFGAYVEASEDAIITNTMRPRTHGCIALGPSGNLQGSIKCFDLKTGMVVKRRVVHELPMPDSVIRRISYWEKKSKQAQFPEKLQFLNRLKERFEWDGNETEFDEALMEQPAHPELPAEFPGMTLTWHVDDLKASHRDSFELTKFILYLAKIYGNQITVNRGVHHDYLLGMDLDYSLPGKVRVSMIKYVDKVLDDFPEAITKRSSTPAADHLFQIRDPDKVERQGKRLSEEQARHFHHTVAQLLFLSGRARRDIQTAVAFLTTRVKQPDEDDWGKLKRVLQYLLGTKHMKLTLSVDNLSQIKWWVDASYNTHEDCKGQTGAMMSLGEGAVDNKSTILLATNGRWSSSKRTKHIKSRYFFVKDRVEQGDLEVQHMPTDKMWSDILTKPKQGKVFREMRGKLMNVPEEYDDEVERRSTPEYLLTPPNNADDWDEDEGEDNESEGSHDDNLDEVQYNVLGVETSSELFVYPDVDKGGLVCLEGTGLFGPEVGFFNHSCVRMLVGTAMEMRLYVRVDETCTLNKRDSAAKSTWTWGGKDRSSQKRLKRQTISTSPVSCIEPILLPCMKQSKSQIYPPLKKVAF
eukprot:CCRYP_010401-RA/>CCRYP_010401-RA protein AED:0.15 eAED:0.13 QI:0/0/0/0.5/1/1/8/0/1350